MAEHLAVARRRPHIHSLQSLGIWFKEYRTFLLAIHEMLNGHGCLYSPEFHFLGHETFGNPRSNIVLKEAFEKQTELKFVVNGFNESRGSQRNITFYARIQSMTQISDTEWLLGLVGTIKKQRDHDEFGIKVAAYYNTYDISRERSFILLPLEIREQVVT